MGVLLVDNHQQELGSDAVSSTFCSKLQLYAWTIILTHNTWSNHLCYQSHRRHEYQQHQKHCQVHHELTHTLFHHFQQPTNWLQHWSPPAVHGSTIPPVTLQHCRQLFLHGCISPLLHLPIRHGHQQAIIL